MGSLHQMKDPRDHAVVTHAELQAARAAQLSEQLAAIKQVPSLRRQIIKAQPIVGGAPLAERLACADALDTAVETFGLSTVMRCLALVCAANSIDISTRTINDLAAGEEIQ
jgi:hypothetical protein